MHHDLVSRNVDMAVGKHLNIADFSFFCEANRALCPPLQLQHQVAISLDGSMQHALTNLISSEKSRRVSTACAECAHCVRCYENDPITLCLSPTDGLHGSVF